MHAGSISIGLSERSSERCEFNVCDRVCLLELAVTVQVDTGLRSVPERVSFFKVFPIVG